MGMIQPAQLSSIRFQGGNPPLKNTRNGAKSPQGLNTPVSSALAVKPRRAFWKPLLFMLGGFIGLGAITSPQSTNLFPSITQAAGVQKVVPATDDQRNAATKQFDELVEKYTVTDMTDEAALESLKQIDSPSLDQRYKGLYMLFDHYLQREIFNAKEGRSLQRLGVDITPAKERHLDFENSEDYPKPSPALLAQGGIGQKRYDKLLELDHFVNLNTPELIDFAKAQYDKIEAQMNVLAMKMKGSKDWREVYQELRKKHPSKQELLPIYRQEVEKAKQFLKDKNLISMPPERLDVIETPSYYRDSVPFAAYLHLGKGYGQFFVTTVIDSDPAKEEEQLRAHHYGFIPAVTVHEAFPGHHLQHAHTGQIKIDDTDPSYKTRSRIFRLTPYSTYFAEGWGVYSEDLMREQGYYAKGMAEASEEEVEIGALRNILWRAARAWIDPQVHTGKMTYDQAVDFLVDRVLMERDRAEIEVNRYFKHPTEVTSYLIGKLQFDQLRQQRETKEKKNFQLKNFHDELFKEGKELPVPVIARMRFDEALALKKASKEQSSSSSSEQSHPQSESLR